MQIIIFISLFVILFFISRVLTREISGFIFGVSRSQGFSMRLFHTLFLPGVLVHELAHLVTAEVMFVKTSGLSFELKQDGDGVVMGSVGIEKTDPIRRALIGVAPVLVGFLVIFLSTIFLLSTKSPFSGVINFILIFIIVFEIGNTMYSSKRDLDGTIELLAVIALIFGVAYFFGFRIPESVLSFLNSHEVQSLFLKANYIIAIPLIIDVILIGILKSFRTR